RKRFHVEFLIVRVTRYEAHLETLHQQDARRKMALHVGRKPDFIVDIGLLENETRTFLHIGEQPACNLYVTDKIRFQTRHIVGFFVNPNHPGKLLDNLFFKLMRLEFRVRLKIEDQNVLSTKALAARVHELASAQKTSMPGSSLSSFFPCSLAFS